MIDRLHYDFDEGKHLTLDVPSIVFSRTMGATRLPEVLEQPEGLLRHESGDGGERLTFVKEPFASLGQHERGSNGLIETYASYWLYALQAIRNHTVVDQLDPAMDVQMSVAGVHDASDQGRRGMSAELAWPMRDFDRAQTMATVAMRDMALTFQHVSPHIIDAVYASVNQKSGVTLEALDVGSCSLDTNGLDYRPDQRRIRLSGHNLYNRQIVLICLTGLVALARQSKGQNRQG